MSTALSSLTSLCKGTNIPSPADVRNLPTEELQQMATACSTELAALSSLLKDLQPVSLCLLGSTILCTAVATTKSDNKNFVLFTVIVAIVSTVSCLLWLAYSIRQSTVSDLYGRCNTILNGANP